MDFDWNYLLGKFQPSLLGKFQLCQLVLHHVVGDTKLDAQEKLSVLTTFSGFTGLCRVSIMWYMELLDKTLTGQWT